MGAKIAIACLGVLVGIGLTRLVTWSIEEPRAPEPRVTARAERPAPIIVERGSVERGSAELGGVAPDELRSMVAEEVRAALRDQAAQPTTAPSAPPPEPTAGFAETRSQVAERVAQGAWRATDRDWMRGALAHLNDVERKELVGQVIVAANRGALRVELEGPMF